MADRAVFLEQDAAVRCIAGAGPQVVVEAAHGGQLFFGGARADVSPVLANESVDLFVLVQRQAAKLVYWHVIRFELFGVDRLQELKCWSRAREEHVADSLA